MKTELEPLVGVGRRAVDRRGDRYGMLVVESLAGKVDRWLLWSCRCDCGGTALVRSGNLQSGNTTSCGCMWGVRARERMLPDDELSYVGAHGRVRRLRGSATQYPCVDCDKKAREWSLKAEPGKMFMVMAANKYLCRVSPDPDDYEPRCAKCHRGHDARVRAQAS